MIILVVRCGPGVWVGGRGQAERDQWWGKAIYVIISTVNIFLMSYAKVLVLCLILTKYKIMFIPDEKEIGYTSSLIRLK